MADNSPIEWTNRPGTKGATWNPLAGCSLASPGCTNCYAMRMAARIEAINAAAGLPTHYAGTTKKVKSIPVWTGKINAAPDAILTKPLRWKSPRTIFVNSMSDLFHEAVPDAVIDRIFAVMALCPQHTFIVLTKRAARMRRYLYENDMAARLCTVGARMMEDGDATYSYLRWQAWPLPNVWLGVSCEDQARADERIPDLLATPAAVRFVSAEPLLGPIDFERIKLTVADADGKTVNIVNPLDALRGMTWTQQARGQYAGQRLYSGMPHAKLDWIIAGGESGLGARPMHPDWARSIRDQCAAAGTAFFFKQWGAWLDADELLTRIDKRDGFIARGGERWTPPRPLNFSDAAFLANTLGHPFEHHSDGCTMLHLGKKRAGRMLDGFEHSAYPEVRA